MKAMESIVIKMESLMRLYNLTVIHRAVIGKRTFPWRNSEDEALLAALTTLSTDNIPNPHSEININTTEAIHV